MTFDELVDNIKIFLENDGKQLWFLEQSNDALWTRITSNVGKYIQSFMPIADTKIIYMVCNSTNNKDAAADTNLDMYQERGDTSIIKYRLILSPSGITILNAF